MADKNLISEGDFEWGGWEPALYETIEDVPKDAGERYTWTIVEGDIGGDLYAVPGLQRGRLGYLVTVKPWVTGDEIAEWDIRSDDEDDEDGEGQATEGDESTPVGD